MFRAILYTQWKWSRVLLLLAALLAFALPALSLQGVTGAGGDSWYGADLLGYLSSFGSIYPMLAAAIAVLVAVTAWAADHSGRHLYALSLPVQRWQFVLLRAGACLLLLSGPILALWLGALLAVSSSDIPLGLHAYPTLLALRFALATLVAFGFFFAISAGTARTAGMILGICLGLILAEVILGLVGSKVSILRPMLDALFTWPGPFDVFTGRWMLIDV